LKANSALSNLNPVRKPIEISQPLPECLFGKLLEIYFSKTTFTTFFFFQKT